MSRKANTFLGNVRILKERKHKYPYRCYLPRSYVKMLYMQHLFMNTEFICVPLQHISCWGFKTEKELSVFLQHTPEGANDHIGNHVVDGAHIEATIA